MSFQDFLSKDCVTEQDAAVKASSMFCGRLYPFLLFHYPSCDETILVPFEPEDGGSTKGDPKIPGIVKKFYLKQL